MSGKLEGKVALITGSSRGIGRAIALTFAKEGAKICVNYARSKEKAEQVVEEIRKLGGEAIAVKADVSKLDEVKEMVRKVIETFGRLDILVNNAGILYKGSILEGGDEEFYEAFERMWEVNVKGVLYCCREAAKYMVKNKYGKIINIASNAGVGTAFPGTTPYAITKMAVIMITKRLAFELGKFGINVNAIAPGLVPTDMVTAGRTPEEVQSVIDMAKQRSVLGRVGKPEDIANVALFLASDDSSFMTGQVLVVDGGRVDYLTHSL